MGIYIHSPICLHGVMLNWLSTGTALPFTMPINLSVPSKNRFFSCNTCCHCNRTIENDIIIQRDFYRVKARLLKTAE
jgi:hypothetical protein